MEMFLMGAVLSLLGVAVSAALFAAATREHRPEPTPRAAQAAAAAQFFAETAPAPPVASTGVAAPPQVEDLLLRIERHVRLEQAAAESFLHSPTPQSLHGRTASPLMH